MNNSVLETIESYFSHKDLIDFLNFYDQLFINGKGNYLNYFGINFLNNNIDSVKFYAHITEDNLTPSNLSNYFLSASEYESFLISRKKCYKFEKTNLGTVIELKFKKNENKSVKGIFYNIDNNLSISDKKNSLPIDVMNKKVAEGVNFEYGENPIKKKYYYFLDEHVKKYFSEVMKKPFLINANLIEYAETSSFSKVIATFGSKAKSVRIENKLFSEIENSLIDFLCEKYNLMTRAYGFYINSDIKSVYFFDNNSTMNPENNHLSPHQGYYVNTLEKICNHNLKQ